MTNMQKGMVIAFEALGMPVVKSKSMEGGSTISIASIIPIHLCLGGYLGSSGH